MPQLRPLQILGSLYDRLPLKQPVLSALRPLHLPVWLYKHLHFKGIFEIATSVRPFKIVHYGEEIENELFWEGLPGRRERISLDIWMRLSQTARVIIDVGANTGVYSLVSAALNSSAEIHGFEPVANLFARYERNCQLNGFNIRAHRTALSKRAGSGVMREWVLQSVDEARSDTGGCVAVRRFDNVFEAVGLDSLDLVKVDVEGHEPEVLEGMGGLLVKFRPTFLVEVLTDQAGKRLESLVDSLGYIYFDLDEVGPPRSSPHIYRSSHWNYLVCQPHVAETLGILS
jgi:FkbM family methyltransferase